jgi:hypothetical protein
MAYSKAKLKYGNISDKKKNFVEDNVLECKLMERFYCNTVG